MKVLANVIFPFSQLPLLKDRNKHLVLFLPILPSKVEEEQLTKVNSSFLLLIGESLLCNMIFFLIYVCALIYF